MIHIEMTFKNSSCIKKTYKLFNVHGCTGIVCVFDDTLTVTYQIVKTSKKFKLHKVCAYIQ